MMGINERRFDPLPRKISHLPERERRLVLGIVRQFDGAERTGPPRTQGSRLIEKLLPAKRTSATYTSFDSGISASSTSHSDIHKY
jgi:hypothetical protein